MGSAQRPGVEEWRPRVRSAVDSASVVVTVASLWARSKSPQVLVATSHRSPSRTRCVAWSPYAPGRSGRRKNRSARCSRRQPSGSSAHTPVCAASKKPGPALVAVTSRRAPSRTGVPSASVTRRRSRRPSCPKAPASTGPSPRDSTWSPAVKASSRGSSRSRQVVAGAGHPATRLLGERRDLRPGQRQAERLGRHRQAAEAPAAVSGRAAAGGDPQADRVVDQLDGQAGPAAGQRDLAGARRPSRRRTARAAAAPSCPGRPRGRPRSPGRRAPPGAGARRSRSGRARAQSGSDYSVRRR